MLITLEITARHIEESKKYNPECLELRPVALAFRPLAAYQMDYRFVYNWLEIWHLFGNQRCKEYLYYRDMGSWGWRLNSWFYGKATEPETLGLEIPDRFLYTDDIVLRQARAKEREMDFWEGERQRRDEFLKPVHPSTFR